MYESASLTDAPAARCWAPIGGCLPALAPSCGFAALRGGPGLLASPILVALSPYAASSVGPILGCRVPIPGAGPGCAASPILSPRWA